MAKKKKTLSQKQTIPAKTINVIHLTEHGVFNSSGTLWFRFFCPFLTFQLWVLHKNPTTTNLNLNLAEMFNLEL